MIRLLTSLALFALLLWSCGPDKPTCTGQDPDFKVVLKLSARPLPPDTVVHVIYAGSGSEDFRLSEPGARHEVAFCQVADEDGVPLEASAPVIMGAAGAGGEPETPPPVAESIYCGLWTAGFTQIKVSGTGFATMAYDLSKAGRCTVERRIVLDSADAG